MGLPVSIVIPTYRRPTALAATLNALSAVAHPPDRVEIVVVDDAADDPTETVVRKLASKRHRVAYIRQQNAGAAAARNRGAAAAKGEVLIFLDDDMLVEPDHVAAHLEAQTRYPNALVNGHWEFPDAMKRDLEATPFGSFRISVERWVKEGIEKAPLDHHRLSPAAVTAANLSIRRDVFDRLGGFDEGFPYAGYEDQDLSLRAVAAGHTLVYDPAIRLWHNDRRLSLQEFCERQERGAESAVTLAAKHPETHARHPMVVANGPIALQDDATTILRKAVKRLLAAPRSLRIAHILVSWLERIAPASALLKRAYWTMCGLYIFRGVRTGLAHARGETSP